MNASSNRPTTSRWEVLNRHHFLRWHRSQLHGQRRQRVDSPEFLILSNSLGFLLLVLAKQGCALPIALFCKPVAQTYVRHVQRNNRISGKQILKAYFFLNCIAKFREVIQKTPPLHHMHTPLPSVPCTFSCSSWHFIFFIQFQQRALLHLSIRFFL